MIGRCLQDGPIDSSLTLDEHGALAGTSSPLAVIAGRDALLQGGTAADAVVTTALTQVALAAGSWASYSGIFLLVYYDAMNGEICCLNAGYNTVREETDSESIPSTSMDFRLNRQRSAWKPMGRTVLVPGFMAGLQATHTRFGKLPWSVLFGPAIDYAEQGFPLPPYLSRAIEARKQVLTRLPETRAIYTKANGQPYAAGDWFKQPKLAATLRRVANDSAGYMYQGDWAEKFVEAIRKEGGMLTMEDMINYEAQWLEPVRGSYGQYEIYSNGLPGHGGVNLIEAMGLYELSGLGERGHFAKSPEALFWLSRFLRAAALSHYPSASLRRMMPSLDLSVESRLSRETTEKLLAEIKAGQFPRRHFASADQPKNTDAVVAVDRWGNVASATHSINTLMWGDNGITVEGVSVNDSASINRQLIGWVGPGSRVPEGTNPAILCKDGRPRLACSAVGSSLHPRTVQCIIDILDFGMSPEEAVSTPWLTPDYAAVNGIAPSVLRGAFAPGVLRRARNLGLEFTIEPHGKRYPQGSWIGVKV